jgi:predicted RNase H-like nuclease
MARFVGVDGCRFGWVAVAEEAGRLEYRLFGAMSDVLAAHPDAERILVDIPIGLPSKQCPVRPCDLLARKLLGAPRASSVFPPPSRAACRAASVAEARRINLSEVERSLSEQAWGICRKVAEVDALLLAQSAARKVVREMHPEVCFYGLNARDPWHTQSAPRPALPNASRC